MILDEIPALVDPSLEDQLLHDESYQKLEAYTAEIHKVLQAFFSKDSFYKGDDIEEIRSHKLQASLENSEPASFTEVLGFLNDLYIKNTIGFHHPRYVAHLNCPVAIPAIAAESIATAINTAVETWDQSTSATFIEQEVIQWICKEFRLPSRADGVFTSGGTQSNFMALLMARDNYAYQHFGLNLKQNGWSDEVSRFRIFCSDKAHFSVKKNAALLGMGYDSVVPVKTDKEMRMDAKELVLAIEKEKQQGNIPIAVVATLGTTDFGSFDPLETIAIIAKEHDMWVHMDGAYGGCYVLTETHKKYFEACTYVDSITIDFHKSFFQPVSCSAFLVSNKQHFQYVSYYADYLNAFEDKDTERPNLIEKSIQTTRRFDALKVWVTLKTLGAKTIAGYLEKVHFMAKEVYQYLQQKKEVFETIHEPALSTVVFRYKPQGIDDANELDNLNMHIKNTLYRGGLASVASTKFNGEIYLKFTLLNPKNTLENLVEILDLIEAAGAAYTKNNFASTLTDATL
jgi:L-2,4-diaminobutyrate decarboxylase